MISRRIVFEITKRMPDMSELKAHVVGVADVDTDDEKEADKLLLEWEIAANSGVIPEGALRVHLQANRV